MDIYIQDNNQRIHLDVPEEHFVQFIEEDQRLRSEEAGESVSARLPQEILDERFNNPDYNGWHAYWRQDRKDVRFSSLEVWNQYGNQADGSVASAEADLLEAIHLEEQARIQATLRDFIAEFASSLPTVQREVFTAWHYEGVSKADIASSRGVSKAAISKTLNDKVIPKLVDALAAQGVNSRDLSGLLMTPTGGGAKTEGVQE